MAAVLEAELKQKIAAAQAAEEANLAAQAANLAAQAEAQAAKKESVDTYLRWMEREEKQKEKLEGADRLAVAFVELHVETELTKLYNETEPRLTPEKVFTLTLI